MKSIKVFLALFSIIVTGVFLYCTERLTIGFIGLAFLCYIIGSFIHLLAHECGHLLGGLISGYGLLCFQIGPLYIISDNKKASVKIKRSISGQCVMIPKKSDSLKYMAYNLGGVTANIVIIILSSGLLIFHSFGALLLFIEILLVGLKKILINIIPCNNNSGPNDGYIVKLLKKDTAIQKDYVIYLRLYRELFLKKEINPHDYIYERETAKNIDELLYYNEIQDILSSINIDKNEN